MDKIYWIFFKKYHFPPILMLQRLLDLARAKPKPITTCELGGMETWSYWNDRKVVKAITFYLIFLKARNILFMILDCMYMYCMCTELTITSNWLPLSNFLNLNKAISQNFEVKYLIEFKPYWLVLTL